MITQNIENGQENINRYKERISNFSKEFELGLFLYLAGRSILWSAIFFITFLAAAYLILRYTPNTYESTSVLQIKPENTAKLLDVGTKVEGQEDQVLAAIELLRSTEFLKKSLLKLPLRVSYYSEGTFLAYEHYTSTPYSIVFDTIARPSYGTRFYVDFVTDKEGIISGGNAEGAPRVKFKPGEWVELMGFSFMITIHDMKAIIQQQTSGKQNSYFFQIYGDDALIAAYSNNLTINLLNDAAKTVSISCKDQNPVKSRDIVNMIAMEFKEYDKYKRGESSERILSFINEQVSKVESDLERSEDSIVSFKRVNKSTSADKITEINMSRLNAVESDLLNLTLEENVLDQIELNLKKNQEEDSYSMLPLLAGTDYELTLTKLIDQLQKLLIDRTAAMIDVTANHERLKEIEKRLVQHRKLIIESIGSILEKIKLKKENLLAKKTEYESKFKDLPEDEVAYQRIQRDFSIYEKFYTMLLEKRTEYKISQAGNISQHEILEYAHTPYAPVSPKKRTTYLTAFLLAFLLSAGLVLVRYIFHDKINSLNEIIKQTNASLSILGIVPKYKREIPNSQLLVDKNPKSIIAEAFRSIRTNLQFISNEPGPKVMAITSTVSGEGKTFVAINLAGIIAYAGKKVIILDLDMRKPKIHLGFGVDNHNGMSTILIGRDQPGDCIRESVQENLHFITAGPIPPNPSELIISKRMNEIVEYLKTLYDIIVIDNPPVGLVTDGVQMLHQADYPIYIFRADYSRRNFIQNVDRLFNENGIKRLSVILNGVDIQRKSYGYNYGYGYGYGYGNGYGYYDDQKEKKEKGVFSRK